MALTDTQVYFSGNDLSLVVGAYIIDHDFNKLPERIVAINKLARSNKSVVTSAEYSAKEVSVIFHLYGCDRDEAEEALVALKGQLRTVNGDLVVKQASIDTTYSDATLNEISYEWFSNKIILTLVFIVADPIGYEDSNTVLLNTTITASTASNAVSNAGSFDAEPIINITVTTVTGGTDQSLSVTNEETGQGITLTRTWANGDTVEVNSDAKTVVINGASSDFTGQFPVFPPGTGSLGYSDTFTTRSVNLSVTYQKHYV